MKVLQDLELENALQRSSSGEVSASLSVAEHYLATQDKNAALDYYVRAASQGSSVAAHVAATLYEDAGDNQEAVHWLNLACAAGNKVACTHLSIAYMGGLLGLQQSYRLARRYADLAEDLQEGI